MAGVDTLTRHTRRLSSLLTLHASRSDAYFGNNHVFNQTVFDRSKAYWTAPVLNVDMLANSKIARQIESKAYNPTYTYPEKTDMASLLEMAAPIVVFGDSSAGTVARDLVEYLFGKWSGLIRSLNSCVTACLTLGRKGEATCGARVGSAGQCLEEGRAS